MLVVTSTYLYTVIFIFHLPYMDVYLNLPISKIVHIYRGLLYHRTCKPDFLCSWPFRQVKIRNKWPDRKKIANKRFIADLC